MPTPSPQIRIRNRSSIPGTSQSHPAQSVSGEVLEPIATARFACVAIDDLKPAKLRLRKGGDLQLHTIKTVITRFGLVLPVLVDADYRIIDGHMVWRAAKELGVREMPVALLEGYSDAEIKALRIALHKTYELGQIDEDVLKADLDFILKVEPLLLDFTGFTMPEIDVLTLVGEQAEVNPDDEVDELAGKQIVSREGDLWLFSGGGRLLCANSRCKESYLAALGENVVQMVLSDPPYGIKIAGAVSRSRHGEFVEGSNMSPAERLQFFGEFLQALNPVVPAGCIVDLFMDHRGLKDLLIAVDAVGLETVCIATWEKNPGMGGLYRIASEFVVVGKQPGASSINNIQLGRFKRNRTTIWCAPGLAGFGKGREEALASHPTRKPVSLLAEAILDTSHRGGVVLDPFAGSGSTLVAAHRMARIGVGIELDAKFVDVAVRRMEAISGEPARHAETGLSFAEVAVQRSAAPDPQDA